jgi:hypothetical protein
VLLIVVSPDASGVNLPVSLTLRSASASAPGSESVDPGMPATGSGTSARTLGAAYPFGGGRAVASALGAARGVAPPHWVVLDARTMAGLGSPGPVSVDLPRPVDVFDGVNLYSFPAGAAAVPTEQLGLLMTGVSGWTVAERAAVRRQIEIEIWRRLTSPGARLDTVRTDLTTDQVRLWVQQARS